MSAYLLNHAAVPTLCRYGAFVLKAGLLPQELPHPIIVLKAITGTLVDKPGIAAELLMEHGFHVTDVEDL